MFHDIPGEIGITGHAPVIPQVTNALATQGAHDKYMLRMNGKNALITGASSGIGQVGAVRSWIDNTSAGAEGIAVFGNKLVLMPSSGTRWTLWPNRAADAQANVSRWVESAQAAAMLIHLASNTGAAVTGAVIPKYGSDS